METFFNGPVRPVGNHHAQLSESPVWCNHSQSLLWVDIEQQRLLRYWPTRDVIEQRPFATLFSAALLTERHE
ncbi:MAG: SMP-30/gluconolactonase/LRE family protein [Sodalis sp. (in: enterobacteria)]|uniref:SMP-30/gluconolactonase/LRE family protein n=1 Tax=Sodalis sp. (in: enterobacteria) TaxID=1898979 RepID=UPI003F40B2A8